MSSHEKPRPPLPAEALSLPVGTIKSRLNRARVSLRGFLENDKALFAPAA